MKRVIVIVTVLVLVFGLTSTAFAGTGFVDNKNSNARIYNGYYEDNAYLVMKWSKDWTPMAAEPEGAWLTNHWEWYTNDYNNTDYGYTGRAPFGTGTYKLVEFTKMEAVVIDKVPALTANGATVIWGNIVILSDRIQVYDAATGTLIETLDVSNPYPKRAL